MRRNASETFGQRLRGLREERGLLQEQVARDLDVTLSTVSRLERDKSLPHGELLMKIAEYFEIGTDYLLFGIEPQSTTNIAPPPSELVEFDRFLKTDYGRIAQERGYVGTLATMRYPYPPSLKIYKALVAAFMLEDARDFAKSETAHEPKSRRR
jgi:transcriptional regulator with XRE-family HTH domain